MKELKTLYPYGLNDKCGNRYFSEYHKDKLGYSVFSTQPVKRKQRGKGKRRNVDNVAIMEEFSNELCHLIDEGKNWRRFCYQFLIQCSLKVLTTLKLQVLCDIGHRGKDVSDFLSDLVNHRFRLSNEPTPSRFMRVFFDNKGIEIVNIPRLLHKVNDAISDSFKVQAPPTVLFLRSRSIGSQIFNYKKVVEDLETKEWDADAHTCACSNSEFCDSDHGHIVTGNLNIVANDKLRLLLSKGPTYREANNVDWKKVFHCINGVLLRMLLIKLWMNGNVVFSMKSNFK